MSDLSYQENFKMEDNKNIKKSDLHSNKILVTNSDNKNTILEFPLRPPALVRSVATDPIPLQ